MFPLNIDIRHCGVAQANDICTIHNQSFLDWINLYGILYGYQSITPNDVKKWLKNENNRILGAFENKSLIGFLHYRIERLKGDINDIFCIEIIETAEGRGQSRIAVIPEKRRKGVALKLLRYVLDFSKSQNIDVVVIYTYNHNQKIHNILHELGFVHERVFYYSPFSTSKPFVHDSILAEFNLLEEIPLHQNPNNEIHVREFQLKDLKDIRQIFIDCRPDMLENASESEIGNFWLEENWAVKTLVAEYQGEVVGCMEFSQYGLIGIPGIKKQYQRKGIGSQLLLEILQNMKSNGFTKALADTGVILSNAIELYRKLEFDISKELWAWVKIT